MINKTIALAFTIEEKIETNAQSAEYYCARVFNGQPVSAAVGKGTKEKMQAMAKRINLSQIHPSFRFRAFKYNGKS